MKSSSILSQHSNIATWISDAKRLATEECISILNAEFTADRAWAIRTRSTRLMQLCSEVLTMKLIEASDYLWSSNDFAGPAHSAVVTAAIKSVHSVVQAHYRVLVMDTDSNSPQQ